MGAIAYSAIRDRLKVILEGDSRLEGVRVYVEEEPNFGLQDRPAIALFADRRIPPPGQPLASGQRTRYHLRHSLWVVAFSLENFAKACEIRDSLIGNLELVLMQNRTINTAGNTSLVSSSWLEGGEFLNARTDSGAQCFVAMGETVFVSEVTTAN